MEFIKFLVSLPILFVVLVLQLFFLPYAIVAKKREHWPGAKLGSVKNLV